MVTALSHLHFDDELTAPLDGPCTTEIGCTVIDGMTQCPAPIVQSSFTESQQYAAILTQELNGKPSRYPLSVFHYSPSLSQPSPVNDAIKRITGGTRAPWCGPAPIMNFNGS